MSNTGNRRSSLLVGDRLVANLYGCPIASFGRIWMSSQALSLSFLARNSHGGHRGTVRLQAFDFARRARLSHCRSLIEIIPTLNVEFAQPKIHTQKQPADMDAFLLPAMLELHHQPQDVHCYTHLAKSSSGYILRDPPVQIMRISFAEAVDHLNLWVVGLC